MNATKLSYALILGLAALVGCSRAMEPVDHRPIADLVAILKSNGHKRIAQGVQLVPVNGPAEGQWTIAKASLMVTANRDTGEWSIAVFHDDTLGSTLLIGKNLEQFQASVPLDSNGYRKLFHGEVTFTADQALKVAAAYRQQDIDSNMLTLNIDGKKVTIAQGDLHRIMTKRISDLKKERSDLARNSSSQAELARVDGLIQKYETEGKGGENSTELVQIRPVSFDLFVSPSGRFKIVAQDRNGNSIDIAMGESFAENP